MDKWYQTYVYLRAGQTSGLEVGNSRRHRPRGRGDCGLPLRVVDNVLRLAVVRLQPTEREVRLSGDVRGQRDQLLKGTQPEVISGHLVRSEHIYTVFRGDQAHVLDG